ncbi:4Fe-4S dicluster domain-containing protein [Desulfoscipio sp. XC116]|uniref:4Fe-4S dicluster domain-containing protein n=1 Tax=Desulfoscipio sp. XC116 TaxID=3144975 RepID=UPI00325A47CF
MANKVSNITVNEKNCKRCGYCIEFCPGKVYVAAKDGLPLVSQLENCTNCGLCALRCPDFAIELEVAVSE